MKISRNIHGALAAAMLAACVQMPSGPTVPVMPPPGKPFDVFVADEQACRNYASQSLGTSPAEAANAAMAGSMAVGTAIGAAAGALTGGREGAGGGAAFGLLAGTAIGVNQASYSGSETQRRYDIAYSQCMYARGNVLPGQTAPAYAPPPRR
jgi:hypothetical protein